MGGLTVLDEARAVGLKVLAGVDGRLIVRGPRSAEALANRLLSHKAEVLAAIAGERERPGPPATGLRPACRCGSIKTVDVRIHDGLSVRRDCSVCRRFIEFPVWYGNTTGHNDQHPA